MINPALPTDWRDLQKQAALILSECGLKADVDKRIRTVRGTVNVDVFASDPSQTPESVFLCECKRWKTRVTKMVVHALRQVVTDYGANWGLIISAAGFQSGAIEAAQSSNVRLLTWAEFEKLWADRWIKNYMLPAIRKFSDSLIYYTEPVNFATFKRADALPRAKRERFIAMRKAGKHQQIAFFALRLVYLEDHIRSYLKRLPLLKASGLPKKVGQAGSLRGFLHALKDEIAAATEEYNEVFATKKRGRKAK